MDYKNLTSFWFKTLQDELCQKFEALELEYITQDMKSNAPKFIRKEWQREGGGGGLMSVMHGNVFEKIGVNFSSVHGKLSQHMKNNLPGAADVEDFFATGISIVAHPMSPLVPSAHFNTRYLETATHWFGGGADMTPVYPDKEETHFFHSHLKDACDKYNPQAYQEYSKACDEYFYLPHRKEARGVGGIFYDYVNSGNFTEDFNFTKDVGKAFAQCYVDIVRKKMHKPWGKSEKNDQLIKRGRYVEFNLLYDRGTKFGLMTNGHIEAIFMSLPPLASWK